MKTDQEIKEELFVHIKGSALEDAVTGVLTKRKRPLNSKKEDIIISVLANQNAQRQEAFVNVNIYVQDQNVKKNGQYEENGERLTDLSRLAADFFENFWIGPARVSLEEQRVFEVENGTEHVINNRLLYLIENE